MSAELHQKPVASRRVRTSAGQRLRRAVLGLSDGMGVVERHGEKPWASITFSGARHTLSLRFDGAEAVAGGERLIAVLPDHEFTLPGQLVAEASVTAVEHTMLPQPHMQVECELLLLDEA